MDTIEYGFNVVKSQWSGWMMLFVVYGNEELWIIKEKQGVDTLISAEEKSKYGSFQRDYRASII
jgi:hypothetical protein